MKNRCMKVEKPVCSRTVGARSSLEPLQWAYYATLEAEAAFEAETVVIL